MANIAATIVATIVVFVIVITVAISAMLGLLTLLLNSLPSSVELGSLLLPPLSVHLHYFYDYCCYSYPCDCAP